MAEKSKEELRQELKKWKDLALWFRNFYEADVIPEYDSLLEKYRETSEKAIKQLDEVLEDKSVLMEKKNDLDSDLKELKKKIKEISAYNEWKEDLTYKLTADHEFWTMVLKLYDAHNHKRKFVWEQLVEAWETCKLEPRYSNFDSFERQLQRKLNERKEHS